MVQISDSGTNFQHPEDVQVQPDDLRGNRTRVGAASYWPRPTARSSRIVEGHQSPGHRLAGEGGDDGKQHRHERPTIVR